MELIESPKSAYLLDASLEILHFESNEWMSEIAFWKDETGFFQKLLEKIAPRVKSMESRAELEHLQNQIILFRFELLDQLKDKVSLHEKYLSNILDAKEEDSDQFYREKHKSLSDQIAGFANEIKKLKGEIFTFYEQFF